MATYKHIRSATANKRPTTSIADGQLAINTNTASPGLFFKDSAGTGIVKVGPVHVGTTAPNSTPAAGGSSGNYLGEQWLDTSVSPAQMKVWNGSAWIGVVADELPVSKLQDGAARQLIQTDAAGTGVEWTSNIDVPGTLDVTGASTLDSTLSVAGVSSFASGSAAAPSLTFTGDTNTGIYRPGADQVAISTNGTGRLFVDSSGRVGVGATPASVSNLALDCINTGTQNTLRITSGSAGTNTSTSTLEFTNTFSGSGVRGTARINSDTPAGGTSTLAFLTSSSGNNPTERLRITSDGKVGLGTSDPQSFATFNGGTSAGFTDVLQLSAGATSADSGPGLTFNFNYGDYASWKGWQLGVIRAGAQNPAGSYAGYLSFYTNAGGSLTEKLRITSDGKLGLGSSSPVADLDIAPAASSATLRVQARSNTSPVPAIELMRGTGTTFGQDIYADYRIKNDNAQLVFEYAASGTTTERMRIDSSGNVGIGTSSPLQKLHIEETSGDGAILIEGSNLAQIILSDNNGGTNDKNFVIRNSQQNLLFGTQDDSFSGFSEVARIDNSGRLLVGTSSASATLNTIFQGHSSSSTSEAIVCLSRSSVSASGDSIGQLRFTTSNGANDFARIEAEVDGTPGASDYPGRLVFSTTADGASSPTERMRITNTGYIFASGNESGSNVNRIAPVTDDVGYLGDSGHRWQAVYATNGTIQTSDEREKTDIQDSILGADFIRSLRPVSYRWKIGGYETTFDEDGNRVDTPVPGVRNHYGFIAQEVKQACGNADFGGWLLEDLDDPNSKQSLRLHEFISPMVKALQEALNEIDTLKAKVAALEAQ
jgi:hypothetical protein